MIGRLNHVAIAVPDLAAATALYRDALGGKVSQAQALPEHGVTVVFVELPNTKVELLEPLGEDSPISKYLESNPSGGMHHICFEVDDIIAEMERLRKDGFQLIHEEPRKGADNKWVCFIHPKSANGVLIELCQEMN